MAQKEFAHDFTTPQKVNPVIETKSSFYPLAKLVDGPLKGVSFLAGPGASG
jgi:hypothetical protein